MRRRPSIHNRVADVAAMLGGVARPRAGGRADADGGVAGRAVRLNWESR
jgi:hypothetical protein